MERRQLSLYFIDIINTYSRYYKAYLSKEPRIYLSYSNGSIHISYRHGILLKRHSHSYWLLKNAFIFESQLQDKIRRLIRKDISQLDALDQKNLSLPLMQSVIHDVTFGNITLGLHKLKKKRY